MDAKELTSLIASKDYQLVTEMTRSGGLRGLFDPHSAEFKYTTIPTKIRLLRRLQKLDFSIPMFLQPFISVMKAHSYDAAYAYQTFADGVSELLDTSLLFGDEN